MSTISIRVLTFVCWLLTAPLMLAPGAIGGDFPGLHYGPGTTVIDAPRLPSGIPDYRQAIANKLSAGVTPDKNAWCLLCENFRPSLPEAYLPALKKEPGFENAGRLPLGPWPDDPASRDSFWVEMDVANSRPWTRDECPRVAAWLESNREPLDLACRAVARPMSFAPIIVPDGEPVVQGVLGHGLHSRDLAWALSARANHAIGLGRFEDAWSDVLAGHRLARHLGRGHSVIELMFGWLVVANLKEATVEAIVSTPGGPEAVASRWRALEPHLLCNVRLAEILESERLLLLDSILRYRSSRFALDTYFFEDPPLRADVGPLQLPAFYGKSLLRFLRWKAISSIDANEDLKLANQYYDEAITAFKRDSIRTRASAFRAIDEKYLTRPGMPERYPGLRNLVAEVVGALRKFPIVGMLRKHAIPFEQVDEGVRRNSQWNQLFLASALAEMHRRETGRDIETGAVFVGLQEKFLPGSTALKPTDLYHKKPLRVRREPEALVIYSVGPNGRDDIGRTWNEEAGDGDFTVRLPRRPPGGHCVPQ